MHCHAIIIRSTPLWTTRLTRRVQGHPGIVGELYNPADICRLLRAMRWEYTTALAECHSSRHSPAASGYAGYRMHSDSINGTEPAVYKTIWLLLKQYRTATQPQALVSMTFYGRAPATTAAPANKNVELADPPPDSISSIAFSPVANYLAVGSWDNNVSSSRESRRVLHFIRRSARFACTKLTRTDGRKGRRCMRTRALC